MTYDTIMKAGISDPDSSNIRDFRSRKRKQGVYRVPSFNYQKTTANGKKFIREQRVNLGNPGQLKLKHGFVVPVMEGYEQYGLKYTDKRGTLNINNPAFNGVKDYRSKFVTSKKRVGGKFKWFDSRTGKVFDAKAAKEYIAEKNDVAAKAYY